MVDAMTMTSQTSPTTSLQLALHAATRTRHTNLNKDITARLPLCLPPDAIDPTKYYFGILTFAQIFFSFEQAVGDALQSTPNENESRIRNQQLLQVLSTEGLPRSDSLRNDLELLSARLELRTPTTSEIEAELREKTADRTHYIVKNITSKPHLALAYTWTMYLALFNGGRYLYRSLAAAGPDFWLEPSRTLEESGDVQSLSFWRFEITQQDPNAEELKMDFKRNFEQASEMLSETEKEEVVKEAVDLFDLCLTLVKDLDLAMMTLNPEVEHCQDISVSENHKASNVGPIDFMWQAVSSTLLAPAYKVFNSRWTRPVSGEVKAAE